MPRGSDSGGHGISDQDVTDDDETQPPSPPPRAPSRPPTNLYEDIHTDGRIVLTISFVGDLHPTFRVRSAATAAFQQDQDPKGYYWSNVSPKMKNTYFLELKKRCYWDEKTLSTTVVRQKWEKIAGDAYSDFVCKVRRRVGTIKQSSYVKEHVLREWKRYWETPEFKKMSLIASRNRNSEVNGPGSGPVIHHGGSRSSVVYSIDIEMETGIPREYAGPLTTLKLHCKNDVWTDPRAKEIYEETQRRIAAERETVPGIVEEREVTTEIQHEIYKEVAPVNSKGRVLGQGSLSQLYMRRGSRSDACSPLSVDRIKEIEARLKEKEEEHAKFVEEQAKFQEEQAKFQEEQAMFQEEQARKEAEQARHNAERDAEVKELKDQLFGFMAAMKKMSPLFHDMSSESLS